MYSYLCVFFALLCIGQFPSTESNSVQDNDYKFLGKYPTPKITQSPIDISSKEAKNVTLSPVILRGVVSDRVKVINTGKSVILILDQPETNSEVTGGPFLNERYKFEKVRIYWVNDVNGVAATTVDGKDGTPIEKIWYFYNVKYGSFKNALKYRDGIAQISFRIKITDTENPLFSEFGEKLKQIQHPGSSTKTTLGTAIKWYNSFPPSTNYYAYPASYTNERTQQQYFCSIVIILPHYRNMYISKKQFDETLGSLKNEAGGPLMNKSPQYPHTMTVVQSSKIKQYSIKDQNGFSQKPSQEETKPMMNSNEEESQKQDEMKSQHEQKNCQEHQDEKQQQKQRQHENEEQQRQPKQHENEAQHQQEQHENEKQHQRNKNEERQNQHQHQIQQEKENRVEPEK